MTQTKDIAWKPTALCIGVGLAGIAVGAFLLAPAIKKIKDKKLTKKKTKESPKSNLKKAA